MKISENKTTFSFIAQNSMKTLAEKQWEVQIKPKSGESKKSSVVVLREKPPETQEDKNSKLCW